MLEDIMKLILQGLYNEQGVFNLIFGLVLVGLILVNNLLPVPLLLGYFVLKLGLGYVE